MARRADLETTARFSRGEFVLEFKREKLFDVTVKSYEFVKETIKPEDRAKYPPWAGDFIMKKTDKLKDYTLPYLSLAVPGRSLKLPAGYVLAAAAARSAGQPETARHPRGTDTGGLQGRSRKLQDHRRGA